MRILLPLKRLTVCMHSNPSSASSSDARLSIADEIAKVEDVATTKKPTRSAVRRKIQPSQGPMDNFLKVPESYFSFYF